MDYLDGKQKTAKFSVRFSEELREYLQMVADREKVVPAFIVRKALEEFFERDKEEQEIKLVNATVKEELPLLLAILKTKGAISVLADRLCKE